MGGISTEIGPASTITDNNIVNEGEYFGMFILRYCQGQLMIDSRAVL